MGGAQLKNWDQIFNVVMTGHSSFDDPRAFREVRGHVFPERVLKFELLKLIGNAFKLSMDLESGMSNGLIPGLVYVLWSSSIVHILTVMSTRGMPIYT